MEEIREECDSVSKEVTPDRTTHSSKEERNFCIRNDSQNQLNQLTGDGRTPDTASARKWRPLVPKKPDSLKRQQNKLRTTGSPEVHNSKQIPVTPGYYYYDTETFTAAALPDGQVYAPGSDYCSVKVGKDSDDDSDDDHDDDISESSRNNSMKSKGGVHIKSKLSGLTTLNINIQLNVADLVQSSLSGRHRQKRTQKKKVQRLKHPDYEIPEMLNYFQRNDTSRQKEAVEKNMKNNIQEPEKTPPLPPKSKKPTKSILNEPVQVPFRQPMIPISQEFTPSTKGTVTKFDAGEYDKDDELECINENESVPPADPTSKGAVLKRYHSEPASLVSSSKTAKDKHISNSAAYDVYSTKTWMQNEVKRLVEANDWCVIYTERDQTETRLSDGESQDGSFAVICENVEENPHYPFTLLLKFKGKVTRTPIRQIQEYRKTKYELLSIRKDSIEKLINHFRKKPLPDFKIKLRTMQYGSAVKL